MKMNMSERSQKMDFCLSSVKQLQPDVFSEFNKRDQNWELIYDRIIISDVIYETHNWGYKLDIILSRDNEKYFRNDLTVTTFKRCWKYMLFDYDRITDFAGDIEEVLLPAKRYIKGQSSYYVGSSCYDGATCDVRLVFEKIRLTKIQ